MATVSTDYSSLTEIVNALNTAPDYRDYFDDWRVPYDSFIDAAEGVNLTFNGFGNPNALSGAVFGSPSTTWSITGSNLVIPATWSINNLTLTNFGGSGSLMATSAAGIKFNTSTFAFSGSISEISFTLGARSVDLQGSGPAAGTANFTVKHLEISDSIVGGYHLTLESTAGVMFNNNPDSLSFMIPVSGNINSIDLTLGTKHLTASGISISALTFYNADTEPEIIALVNSIFGGNNTHVATMDNETLIGGGGNDVYDFGVFQPGEASELGNGGTDLVKTQFSYTLGGAIENALLTGGLDSDLTGNGLNNLLTGNSGRNSLYGGDGNDALIGGDGNDTLEGGAGKDSMNGGLGDDTFIVNLVKPGATAMLEDSAIVDPGGTDTLVVLGGAGVTTFTLVVPTPIDIVDISGVDAGANVAITGTPFDNIIIGNGGHNSIKGGAGNDSLIGGNGNDTLDGEAGNDTYVGGAGDDVYVIAQALDTVSGGDEDFDTVRLALAGHALHDLTGFTDIENVIFTGTGAVSLIGNGADNRLAGGAGADTLDGRAGDDTLIGNAGNDRYLVDSLADVLFDSGGIDTVVSTVAGWTLGTGFENLILNADGLGTGNALNNVLTDGEGTVTLQGLAGNDTYNITSDDDVWEDTLHGGAGIDKVFVTLADGQLFHMGDHADGVEAGIIVFDGLAGTARLTGNALNNLLAGDNESDDSISGGDGNDTILGGGGNDTLQGDAGKDSMAGGAGDDLYIFNLYKPAALAIPEDTVAEAANAGYDTLEVHPGTGFVASPNLTVTLGANFEALDFSQMGEFSINGIGNALNNVLIGNGGANKLDGAAGNDSIDGAAGNDTVLGGAGNDTLNGCDDNDLVDGGAGNDLYIEDAGDDRYVFAQAGDAITLDGGSGAGIDTALMSVTPTQFGGGGTIDLTGFDFLENAVYTGAGAVTLIGNTADNILKGGAGADTISGAGGNDTLIGGAGNDSFTGGAGADSFVIGKLAAGNVARIADYEQGSDHVALAGNVAAFAALFDGGGAFIGTITSNGTGTAVGSAAQLVYNETAGTLFYDANGAAAGGAIQLALFGTLPATLTAADFTEFAGFA